MLNDKKPPLIIPTEKGEIETLTLLDKVGVNRATTATCFCDIVLNIHADIARQLRTMHIFS